MPQLYMLYVYRSQILIHQTFSFPNLHSSLKFSLIILTIAFFKILFIILRVFFLFQVGEFLFPSNFSSLSSNENVIFFIKVDQNLKCQLCGPFNIYINFMYITCKSNTVKS